MQKLTNSATTKTGSRVDVDSAMSPVALMWTLLLLLLGGCAAAAPPRVLVVGAGYAGLTAARHLQQRGVNVTVLEAGPAAGGRGLDLLDPNGRVRAELGVEFIGTPAQSPHAYELFQGLGLSVFPSGAYVANASQKLVCRNFRNQTQRLGGPLLIAQLFKCVSAGAAAEAAAVLAELEALIDPMNSSAPWAHPQANILDTITWSAWMRQRLGPEALQFIERGYAPGLSDAGERVSMLHAVFLAKTGGGLIQGLTGFNNGFRVVEGGGAAARILASQLGSAIQLNTPVASVSHELDERILLTGADGSRWEADYAIVTGSPLGVRRIAFEPSLPHDTERLLAALHQGNSVRVSVIYETPWWRADGLSGSIGDLADGSHVYYGFDSSPADSSCGVIQFHLCGAGGDALMAMETAERHKYLARYLVEFLGPKAANYSQIVSHDFGRDPYVGGGFQANFPPGVWSSYGHKMFDDPANDSRIQFAGTEWTPVGFGYVDGAIGSGIAAARAVERLLQE